jgi:hypothetical protein
MNIDLGYLGKAVLEEVEAFIPKNEGFVVLYDGYTTSGIRVHGIMDAAPHRNYPAVWNNAIIIKVD